MMNLLPGIDVTSQALDAEKLRMELIAQNLANAQTTRGADGDVYQRKVPVFESYLDRSAKADPLQHGVRVAEIHEDPTPGNLVYNPSHPHANEQGMVRMPNVQPAREMVDLIASSRAYQANLSVVRSSKAMAEQALAIRA